jgi:uncharacterized caspase-like protein
MRAWMVALSLGLLVTAGAANAERRIALVVGNGAYTNMPKLQNAVDDADAMTELLKKIGFEVIEGTDLTRDQMKKRLAEFGDKANGADLALLYFSGQSFTVDGTSYLLSIDAKFKPADLLNRWEPGMDARLSQLTSLSDAISETMIHAKTKLVFFDASRVFPRGRVAGPTRAALSGIESEEGTMIQFATGPGQTALEGAKGMHSPFTRALLANIAVPGMEIQQAMTRVRAQVNEETSKAQLPWGHTYLVGEVYLNPAPAAASPENDTK